ncbi:hypothetical protein [Kordiimonas sp.]|uniref:hypothetical protein n=1 Tax=Kordiimonas sp. TaxID=1970157 RepID=UPI003A9184C8
MKTTSLLIATALSASFALAPVYAEAAKPPTEPMTVSKLDAKKAAAFEDDKREIFETLFETHMSLERGAKDEAERQINEAFADLEDANSKGATVEGVRDLPVTKVVELKFGNALLPKVVYVPVGDHDLDVEDFSDALKIKGIERGDIEDAKVKYVRLKIDEAKLIHDLNEAREEIADDDMSGAQAQIHDAQITMIHEFDGGQSAEVIARDHLALTRFMLKAAEYEGAREALEVAEAAFIDLQDKDVDAAGRNAPGIEKIRLDMDELQALISRRDPSLADQIDAKLEKWWNSVG